MKIQWASIGIKADLKTRVDDLLDNIPGAREMGYNMFIAKAIEAISQMQSINPAWYYNDITPDNQRPLEYNKNGGA